MSINVVAYAVDLLLEIVLYFLIMPCLIRDVVTFPGFVDCIYLDAPGEVILDNGLGDTITIQNTK